MAAPLFSSVHHVAVICSDYERSKRFYTETLGFAIRSETFRAERRSYKLDLDLGGGVALELFSFPEPPRRATQPEACGLRHLAFGTPAFEAVLRELGRRGVALEPVRTDAGTGQRFTFCADPDGLPIEVYETGAA
jgi:glyoxylase I family protein